MNKIVKPRQRGVEEVESFEFPNFSSKQCQVTKKTITKNMYTVYLDEDIEEPRYYRDACEAISSANEEDIVRLIINTNGGYVDSASILRQSILESQADVIAELHGKTHSAGSMIALACNYVEVKPAASMMIHQASFGVAGASNTVYDHVDFSRKYLNKLIKEIYEDFLTPDEIKNVLTGTEMWLDAEDIGARLEAKYLKQKETFEKQQKELEEKMQEVLPEVVEKQQTKKTPRKKAKSVVQ